MTPAQRLGTFVAPAPREKLLPPPKTFFYDFAHGGMEGGAWIPEQTNLMGTNGLQSVGSVIGQQPYLSKPGSMRPSGSCPWPRIAFG